MQLKQHWETIYSQRSADSLSWYQEHAGTSLRLIAETQLEGSAPIIDVGGGASTLVDGLLAAGYTNLTVLDLSAAALDVSKRRLGPEAARAVTWIEADILDAVFPGEAYELWHDRAIFHFLTSRDERQRYVRTMLHAVRHGGWIIMATFAEEGPDRCSGLPAMRYTPEALQEELGSSLVLCQQSKELHSTPSGAVQIFQYCMFQKQ
jgi:SAM-dependent methyltransferase